MLFSSFLADGIVTIVVPLFHELIGNSRSIKVTFGEEKILDKCMDIGSILVRVTNVEYLQVSSE